VIILVSHLLNEIQLNKSPRPHVMEVSFVTLSL